MFLDPSALDGLVNELTHVALVAAPEQHEADLRLVSRDLRHDVPEELEAAVRLDAGCDTDDEVIVCQPEAIARVRSVEVARLGDRLLQQDARARQRVG